MKELNQRSVPAAIPQLRAEIEALPKDGGGKRRDIPDELKRRIAGALASSGMPISDFAAEVAVSVSAVWSWRKRYAGQAKPKPRKQAVGKGEFKKMTVVEDASATRGSFTIEGPSGIRMTGLGADDVARLWRALC